MSKKMIAATDLSTGELRQVEKNQAAKAHKAKFIKRDRGEKRIAPIIRHTSNAVYETDDGEHVDLTRVRSRADLE